MAIIGGYAARNAQNIAAIQANAAQLGRSFAESFWKDLPSSERIFSPS
jgi:hypothetical protein